MIDSVLTSSSQLQQGRVSVWLSKYGLAHRALGFD